MLKYTTNGFSKNGLLTTLRPQNLSNKMVVALKVMTLLLTYTYFSPFLLITLEDQIDLGRFFSVAALIIFNLLFFTFLVCMSLAKTRYRVLLLVVLAITVVPLRVYSSVSSNTFPFFYDFYLLLDAAAMAGTAFEMYRFDIAREFLYFLPFSLIILSFPRTIIKARGVMVSSFFYLSSIVILIVVLQTRNIGLGAGIASPTVLPSYAAMSVLVSLKEPKKVSRALLPYEGTKKVHNVVLIVDESVRWDMIDLNQSRGTTPALQAMKDKIFNFHKSYSYANCSSFTNIFVRSMVRYGHEADDVLAHRFVWEAMSQAGYSNYLIDAQRDGDSHDFFSKQELESNDVKVIPASHLPTDLEVAKLINKALAERPASNKFILVMKKGAHAPYTIARKENEKFKPAMLSSLITQEAPERIFNSYMSMVYENTNQFFKQLNVDDHTVFIYTSDHGQNLQNLKYSKTHCTTINPSVNEGLVPMLLLGAHDFRSKVVERIKRRKGGTHYDIPFLVLGYAGYAYKDVIDFLGEPINDEQAHGYLYGNVLGVVGPKTTRFVEK
jgi:glucan phosphoethanolaminetransferase (alkaline phosphatase superfamily)